MLFAWEPVRGYVNHEPCPLCERDRLRAALEHLSLYVAANGDDWVRTTALEYLAGAQPPRPAVEAPACNHDPASPDATPKVIEGAGKRWECPHCSEETSDVTAERIAGGAEHRFMLWLMKEIPAGTVISSPTWWSPRIFRAVEQAMRAEEAKPQWDCRCDSPSCPHCGPRLAEKTKGGTKVYCHKCQTSHYVSNNCPVNGT